MKRFLMRMIHVLCITITILSYSTSLGSAAPAATPASTGAADPATASLRADIDKQLKAGDGNIGFDALFSIWNKTSTAVSKNSAEGARLLAMLPPATINQFIQKSLGLKGLVIANGPSDFPNSFSITGAATADGKRVMVTLLYAPIIEGAHKGGNSLTFAFPKDTPLDKIIPGANVKALGKVPISDMRLIISDFDYTDPTTNYPIVKGLNAIVAIDPSAIGIFDLEKIKKVLEIQGTAIIGIATIQLAATESGHGAVPKVAFKVMIPPHAIKVKQFKLSQLADLLTIPMPSKIKDELSNVEFTNIDIAIDLSPDAQSFSIIGTVNIFGAKNVVADYKIFKTTKKSSKPTEDSNESLVWAHTLILEFPDSWSIATSIPELKVLAPLTVKSQRLTLLTNPAGVSYAAFIDIKSLGNNPILTSLGSALGQHLVIYGTLTGDLADAQFNITLGQDRPKEVKMSLGNLISPKFGKLKNEFAKGSFSLGEVHMLFGGKNASQSMEITGTTAFGTTQAKTEMRLVYVGSEWKGDLILRLPHKVKGVSADADKLLDAVPLSTLTLALIQVPFTDPASGVEFEEGFNIGGSIAFDGKMSFVKKILPIKNLEGIDVNGFIKLESLNDLIVHMKLEASLPGTNSLQLGKHITMNKLKLFMEVGFPPEVGLEGAVTIPLPGKYRPKKVTSSSFAAASVARTALELDDVLYIDIPLDEHMTTAMAPSDLAISTDAAGAAIGAAIQRQVATQNTAVAKAVQAAAQASRPTVGEPVQVAQDTEAPSVDDNTEAVITDEGSTGEDTPAPTDALDGEEAPIDGGVESEWSDSDDMADFGAELSENSALSVVGELSVSGEDAKLSCAMDGALEVKGIVLKDLGFEAQISMTIPPLPTGMGFRGEMQISAGKKPKVMQFAAKASIGTLTTSFAWLGSFEGGLYFSDLVGVAFQVMKHAPSQAQKMTDVFKKEFMSLAKKVPKIGIDEFKMAIIPVPTTIAGKDYPEGTTADFKFVLFGAPGQASAHMDYLGMNGTGTISKIALPKKNPLIVISSFDGTSGPLVTFKVGKGQNVSTLITNEFTVDGNIEIKPLALKSAAHIMLNSSGGSYHSVEKMFGLYTCDVEGTLPFNHLSGIRIKGTFKQDALTAFSTALKKASNDLVNASKKELDAAKNKVNNEFDPKIANARETVKKERAKATGAVSGANNSAQSGIDKELAKARKQIQDSKNAIKSRNNRIKKHKGNLVYATNEKAKNVKDQLIITEQEAYITLLLKPGKKVVKGTLDVAKGVVNVTPIDSDPRVSSLITAKQAALAGIKVSSVSASALGKVGAALASAGGSAINLKSVSIDVYLGDLAHGKLPKFSMEGVFFGKKIRIKNVQLDLRDAKAIPKLVGLLIRSLK